MAVKKRPSKPARVSPRAGKTRRKIAVRRRVSPPQAALVPALPVESPTPTRGLSLSGWVVILILAVLGGLVAWALAYRQSAETAAAPAPVAAVQTAPSPAPPVPTVVPSPAPKQPAALTDEDRGADLSLSLGSGKPLRLRCWASSANPARLDIFSRRNLLVYSTLSAPGTKDWQELSWDGKDAQGTPVQPGTYYARPSQKGDQVVLTLKVKK